MEEKVTSPRRLTVIRVKNATLEEEKEEIQSSLEERGCKLSLEEQIEFTRKLHAPANTE